MLKTGRQGRPADRPSEMKNAHYELWIVNEDSTRVTSCAGVAS